MSWKLWQLYMRQQFILASAKNTNNHPENLGKLSKFDELYKENESTGAFVFIMREMGT
jgi:hypothetical protein